jgi:hypothetical protein
MKFTTTLCTDGRGYWSNVKREVKVTRLELNYVNDDQTFGELCVYFDTRTWNTHEDGLIYTDSTFIKQLNDELALAGFDSSDVDYSEQGMQGDDYVSLDVGKHFLKSFKAVAIEEFMEVMA